VTAPEVHDEPVGHTTGQLVTWHTPDHGPVEMCVVYADGPWLAIAPPGSDVGFTVHESQVSM
jgi:hypothetical protein